MKDEGLVPTGSFKARGAAVGVSRAAELGVTGIAMPTNGNAGAAWAAYAARAGMRALVAMPVDAPVITRRECVVAGAELYLVDGLIGDAGALIRNAVEAREGYQDVSTLREPYRIEGKKTMALRNRRAARVAGAGRDPLPDRRRCGNHRDPQGAAGAA